MMHSPQQPTRPTHIPIYADVCLQALVQHNLGNKLSLGGAFALLHYLDYRSTYDVDAWWQGSTTTQEKRQVIETIEQALGQVGPVKRRSFGDVVSIELATEQKKKAFSFQIAERSAQLQPSLSAQWIDVSLDSFADLLASKMTALVQRGTARDFRDIYTICQAGLATPSHCWQLWQQRQQLTGDDADFQRAKVAINSHLERIEQYRPLSTIADPEQYQQAMLVRTWYRTEFSDEHLA